MANTLAFPTVPSGHRIQLQTNNLGAQYFTVGPGNLLFGERANQLYILQGTDESVQAFTDATGLIGVTEALNAVMSFPAAARILQAVVSGPLAPPAANMVLWFDGDQPAFSDAAGTVPATVGNGRVRRINQAAPLTGSWLAPAPGAFDFRPFRDLGAANWQCGSQNNMAQPAGPVFAGNNYTLALAFVPYSANGGGSLQLGMLAGGTDGAGNFGPGLSPSIGDPTVQNIQTFTKGAGFMTGLTCVVGAAAVLVITGDATGTTVRLSIDGGAFTTAFKADAALPATNVANLVLGQIASPINLQASVSHLIAYNTALTGSALAQLQSFLQAKAGAMAAPVTVPMLWNLGDSNTVPYGSTTQQLGYLYASQNSLAGSKANPPRFVNLGFAGCTIDQAKTRWLTQGRRFASSARGVQFALLQVGAASLVDAAGNTALQAFDKMVDLFNTILADGVTPCWHSVLPNSGAGVGAGFEPRRIDYNILGNAYAPFAANRFALASIAGISTVADTLAGPNYQGDHSHLTDAGNALITPVMVPFLSARVP